jgi:hypothetical protein
MQHAEIYFGANRVACIFKESTVGNDIYAPLK